MAVWKYNQKLVCLDNMVFAVEFLSLLLNKWFDQVKDVWMSIVMAEKRYILPVGLFQHQSCWTSLFPERKDLHERIIVVKHFMVDEIFEI